MKLQPENVWVVVDRVGQPCIPFVRPRGDGPKPPLPPGLVPDTGPFTIHAYMLVPESQGAQP